MGVARHGWVRLTPAYGVGVVDGELAKRPGARIVLDPFSGTGTTGLCASTSGHDALLVDLNPFLVWLARAKTRHYLDQDAEDAAQAIEAIVATAGSLWGDGSLWEPALSNITRWWSPSALAALRAIRAACDVHLDDSAAADLVLVAFCQTLIGCSAAAFNHQSMSFKIDTHDSNSRPGAVQQSLTFGGPAKLQIDPEHSAYQRVIEDFRVKALAVVEECEPNPPGSVRVYLGEARSLGSVVREPIDLLITSPPYCNRMSYIRELRPYMYWLRFIAEAKEAGDLDWQAIGGTWGTATSRLLTNDLGAMPPLGEDFAKTIRTIARKPNEPNAKLLSNYVYKYFADTWKHIKAAIGVLAAGAELVYVVGNSTFFGEVVPTERWYADLLTSAGCVNVKIDTMRKRNSNKLLYEFVVTARKP